MYTIEYQQHSTKKEHTMKLHTNTLRASDVRDALAAEQEAGRIAQHVSFKVLHETGSRSHGTGIEIQLEGNARDNGRRAGNSGSYGAMIPAVDGYAATFDEWGWLINALYALDEVRAEEYLAATHSEVKPSVWGTVKYPIYADREDFDEKTGLTYNHAALLPLLQEGYWSSFEGHPDHDGGDPYPFTRGRQLRSRAGAARITREQAEEWIGRGYERSQLIKHSPRMPLSYAQWAHVSPVTV